MAQHVEADAHEQAKHSCLRTDGSKSHGTEDIKKISGMGTEDKGHQPKKPQPIQPGAHEQAKCKRSRTDGSNSHGTEDIHRD